MWAARITDSAIADQLLASHLATPDELGELAAAWQEWADHPDGWLSVLHGEILIQL